MPADDESPANIESKPTLENPELDEFFNRLPANFRWPKPSDEAIAAAVEVIQRMAGGITGAEAASASAATSESCSSCGRALEAGMHFCSQCGAPAPAVHGSRVEGSPTRNGAVHHYHHHYHHFASGKAGTASSPEPDRESAVPHGRAPGSGTQAGGRAELLARQVAQNWVQACNTKHLDDLLELYTPDATLIRSNVPPVRSLPAVREFLHALLEAGLGDLEMESLRVEVMGDIAIDLGRCKMLVPVAMGKRREERGKFLLVLVRQPAGTWKILADSWSSDQSVNPQATVEPARKSVETSPPVRKPR